MDLSFITKYLLGRAVNRKLDSLVPFTVPEFLFNLVCLHLQTQLTLRIYQFEEKPFSAIVPGPLEHL